jgi:hypothetical protein
MGVATENLVLDDVTLLCLMPLEKGCPSPLPMLHTMTSSWVVQALYTVHV